MEIILILRIVYSKDRWSDILYVDLQTDEEKVKTKKTKLDDYIVNDADKTKLKENKNFVPILH